MATHTGMEVVSGVHHITIMDTGFMEEIESHITEDIETEVLEVHTQVITEIVVHIIQDLDLIIIDPEVDLITVEVLTTTEEEYPQTIIDEQELPLIRIELDLRTIVHILDQDLIHLTQDLTEETLGQEAVLAPEVTLVLGAVEALDL